MRRRDEEVVRVDEGYDVLVSAVARSAEQMPAEARDAARARLLEAVRPTAVPPYVRVIRPAIALATAGALLGGVSYAAAESRPGDLLFGLKRSVVSAVGSARGALTRTGRAPAPPALKPVETPRPKRVAPGLAPHGAAGHSAEPSSPGTPKTPGNGKGRGEGGAKTPSPKAPAPNGNGNGSGKPMHDSGKNAPPSRRGGVSSSSPPSFSSSKAHEQRER